MGSVEYFQAVGTQLVVLVIAAMVLERALSVLFEWGAIEPLLTRLKLRAPIALVVAWIMCWIYDYDILATIFSKSAQPGPSTAIGVFLTAATVAGGSKGAILLFQGFLGFSKEAVDARLGRATDEATAKAAGAQTATIQVATIQPTSSKPFWQN